MIKELSYLVYPSEIKTISVEDDDTYGGAHNYFANKCLGFNNGETEYLRDEVVEIPFVKKLDDGTIVPGLQSEQLVFVLLDRTVKLNERFPSVQNERMIEGLTMVLNACKDRVQDRLNRNVMGQLKK